MKGSSLTLIAWIRENWLGRDHHYGIDEYLLREIQLTIAEHVDLFERKYRNCQDRAACLKSELETVCAELAKTKEDLRAAHRAIAETDELRLQSSMRSRDELARARAQAADLFVENKVLREELEANRRALINFGRELGASEASRGGAKS